MRLSPSNNISPTKVPTFMRFVIFYAGHDSSSRLSLILKLRSLTVQKSKGTGFVIAKPLLVFSQRRYAYDRCG
jgi:hypothetical protein